MGVHWKIRFLGGIHEKPIYKENYLKRGGGGRLRQFVDRREGLCKKEEGVFLRECNTSMYTMLDVSPILDPSPQLQSFRKKFFKLMKSNFSIVLCDWTLSKNFFLFYFYLDFLSQTFTVHGTTRGREASFNSSPPLPLASKTLTH